MDIIEKAKAFAKLKHGKDKRKFTGELYYTHPFAVVERLKAFDKYETNEIILAAAYLHDTLEDTNTSFRELKNTFNEEIANLVLELTSNKEEYKDDENKTDHTAKAHYLTKKINNMSKSARIIKFVDREHNISSMSGAPPSFTEKYSKETQYILEHLKFNPDTEEEEIINSIREKIRPYLT
jgi:(p)ppGpp synthase/HD superfamily hydrolase